MYKTINQITIDHKEIAIKQHSKQIGYLTADVRRAKNSVTRAKMQSNFAIRHYTQMSRVHHSNTSWDWLRVAGGNKNLAEHFKKTASEEFYRCGGEVDRSAENLRDNQWQYDAYMSKLATQNMLLNQAYISDKPVTNYTTKDWEHELRNCDSYVQGSIKLKHRYQGDGLYVNECYEDFYKVTMRFNPMTACSSNDEYSDIDPIYIPSITADFLIDKRSAGRHMTDTVLRASPGFAKHRYTGYRRRKILHPHMTDTTSPCLGDFQGPISEALDNFDIPTAVVVLSMFLQQFDPSDEAGRSYRNFPKAKYMFNEEEHAA
jgi:hypothetical protein